MYTCILYVYVIHVCTEHCAVVSRTNKDIHRGSGMLHTSKSNYNLFVIVHECVLALINN